jgi:hypothetical protein
MNDFREVDAPSQEQANLAEENLKANPEWLAMSNARYGVLKYIDKVNPSPKKN